MTEPPSTPQGPGPDWGEMSGKIRAAQGPDRLILISGFVFVVASFLPWFGFKIGGLVAGASINMWHEFFGFVGALLGLLTFLFALTRVVGVNMNLQPMQERNVYLGLGALTALFTIIRFLVKPAGGGAIWSWKYGAFIGLIAGIVVGIGSFQKYSSRP